MLTGWLHSEGTYDTKAKYTFTERNYDLKMIWTMRSLKFFILKLDKSVDFWKET